MNDKLKDSLFLVMEKLSDLPVKDDAEMTQQESDVMKKYFNTSPDSPKSNKKGWMDTIKLSLYITVLFLLLANPWVDPVLCMVPYCGDNSMFLLAFKALLFMMMFVVVYRYVYQDR